MSVVLLGSTSGSVTLQEPAIAGSTTINLPATSGTMAVLPTATSVLPEASGGTGTTTGYYGFKSRIINGAMVIDQRNAGASVTPVDNQFTLDRWRFSLSQASKLTTQQSTVAPTGFGNSSLITSTSAYSVGASEGFLFAQKIEGFNFYDMAWGTASASTVTLSFWVRSSLTGAFGGAVSNGANNRWYPFSYTISSANTWEQKSVTIAGDTSGTWVGATNGTGLNLYFSLGSGATVSGTSGSWGASTFYSVTGATSVVGTNGATFYITGVQLEKGSTATSFDYRPYTTELQLCQRYLPAITLTGGNPVCSAYTTSTTTAVGIFKFYVTPRTPPTGITATAASGFSFSSAANFTGSAIAFTDASPVAGKFILTISGGTAGQGGYIFGSNGAQILFTGCEL